MASSDGKFDDVFLDLLKCKNNLVLHFLEEVFGFLYRRTDFYLDESSELNKEGNSISLAEKIIDLAYKKYKTHNESLSSSCKSNNVSKNDAKEYPNQEEDEVENETPIIDQLKVIEVIEKNRSSSKYLKTSEVIQIEKDKVNVSCSIICDGSDSIQVIENNTIDTISESSFETSEISGEKNLAENSAVLYSSEEFMSYIKDYQNRTNTHFVQQKKDLGFNNTYWNKNSRIQWQTICGKSVSIMFDGVPFVFLGELVLVCHRGRAKASQRSRREKISQDASNKVRLSKKVDCPARIYVKKIAKFLDYKVKKNTEYYKERASKQLRLDLQKNNLLKVQMQYYVRTPDISDHQNHLLGDIDFQAERDRRGLGKNSGKIINNQLTVDSIPVTQEALEQLLFQHPAGSNQQVAVVIDSSGNQQLQLIDASVDAQVVDSSSILFQTLSDENMEIS